MPAKTCPVCGEITLMVKHGDYRMELPSNIRGGFIVIPAVTWMHCDSCGEDILSAELEQAINNHCHEVSRTS